MQSELKKDLFAPIIIKNRRQYYKPKLKRKRKRLIKAIPADWNIDEDGSWAVKMGIIKID
jgi:hypothetical protein